jgi:uncharacterized protein VirK/YbjX
MVVSQAARHQDWKLERFFRVFILGPVSVALHPRLYRQVQTVGRLADFARMTEDQPQFLYKYLNVSYLARGLPLRDRAYSFLNHYQFAQARIQSGLLNDMRTGGRILNAFEVEGRRYEVVLRQAFKYFYEGEWSLCLLSDGDIIYISSFTIVPGSVLKIEAENAVLITRQQGAHGKFPVIAQATKDFRDISPQNLLFSVLQGLALALDIRYIGCVPGGRHVANPQPGSALFRRAYDDFMLSLGAVGSERGFYVLQIPLREKPLKYIKREHRTRTVRKRRYRSLISKEARRLLTENLREGV